MATFEGVRRTGPPVAVQKLREDFYMVHVTISESPSADWKRLFYDTQQAPPPDFLPREVEISGALLKFRTASATLQTRLGWIDKWIERANQKESAMSGRMDDERRRKREELAHEQQELNELNARWTKL